MPLLYDPRMTYALQNAIQPQGWSRTVLLALGGTAGVITTAGLIHMAKKGRPERGPRGWPRTILLGVGGFAGTMLTAGAIHVYKQVQLRDEVVEN